MVSIARPSGKRGFDGTFTAPAGPAALFDRAAVRADIVLLLAPLFLTRFTLAYGKTFLHLDYVLVGIVLISQFFRGKVVIQYDRFLWFLGLVAMTTVPLLLNFNTNMITGYTMFIFSYFFLAFQRPSSTPEQYEKTLRAFQFLVALLSGIGAVQFAAQFVIDGTQLTNFWGLVPDWLFSDPAVGMHDPRLASNGLLEATGLFLPEPSFLGQYTAIGILIELLEFRRPRYLLIMILGLLLSYSGTGVVLLLLFLPLSVQRSRAAAGATAFLAALVIVLVATGIIDLSNFTSRVGEISQNESSGFQRFALPVIEASKGFDMDNVRAVVLGHGPGTIKATFDVRWFGWYASTATWLTLFYEYGIMGCFVFLCYLIACVRGSRCSGVVIAAIIFALLLLQGNWMVLIPLCTLNGPAALRRFSRNPGALSEIAGDDRHGSVGAR